MISVAGYFISKFTAGSRIFIQGRATFNGTSRDLSTLLGLCILFSLAVYVPLAFWLFDIGIEIPGVAEFANTTIPNAADFRPEPAESLIFFCGIILLPALLACLLVAGYLSNRSLPKSNAISGLVALCVITFVPVSVLIAEPSPWLFNESGENVSYYSALFITEILFTGTLPWLIVIPVLVLLATPGHYREKDWLVTTLCLLLITFISITTIFGENDQFSNSVHLQAMMEPMSQVLGGKTLLVDAMSQYGMYPYLLEPVFRLVGLSVLSFTLVLSALTFVSLTLIFLCLRNCIHHPVIRLLGFYSLVSFASLFGKYLALMYQSGIDPFFQYWPIRTIFPALLLAMLSDNDRQNTRRYFAGFVILSIGVLWNLDSGVPALVAWIAYYCYREPNVLASWKHLLTGLVALAGTFFLFALYLATRSGELPDILLLTGYQQVFAYYGYYMLPMPLIHPWNLLILTYLAAMSWTLHHWLQRNSSPGTFDATRLFAIMILGIGLFSYYLGRSHDFVFPLVTFPGFILLTYYLDRHYFYRDAPHSIWTLTSPDVIAVPLLLLIMLMMLVLTTSLLGKAPAIWHTTMERITQVTSPTTRRSGDVMALIARHSNPGKAILLLSHESTFWHVKTGTHSVLPTNFNGMIFRSDFEDLIEEIRGTGALDVYLDVAFSSPNVGLAFPIQRPIVEALFASGYSITDATGDFTFQYWSREKVPEAMAH